MAKRVQFRGGTTAENNAFTGAERELTVDTDLWQLRFHDGETAGGHILGAKGDTGEKGAANDTYDIPCMIVGGPAASEVVLRFVAVRAFSLPASLTGSQAVAVTAADAEAEFGVQKGGTEFATITFAAAGTTGTFASASGATFAAGDVLTVVAPASQDADLADIAITLKGVTE